MVQKKKESGWRLEKILENIYFCEQNDLEWY